MDITCSNKEDPILEFTIKGEFNTYEVENFQNSIQPNLYPNAQAIILDLSHVPYMTSAALRAICILGKTIMQQNLKFIICGLTGLSKEVFFISGFHQVFPTADDLAGARELAHS